MNNTFSEGDLIEATKGDTAIRGRVIIETGHGGPLRLNNMPWSMPTLDTMRSHGFTLTVIEKAAPALPTEPGHYLNEGRGLVYSLASLGDWWYGDERRSVEQMADRGPFTRLEPVADTAKKVLDRIASEIDAINSSDWTFVQLKLAAVAKEFGVTS